MNPYHRFALIGRLQRMRSNHLSVKKCKNMANYREVVLNHKDDRFVINYEPETSRTDALRPGAPWCDRSACAARGGLCRGFQAPRW